MIIQFSRKKYFICTIGCLLFTCVMWSMLSSGEVADDDILICLGGLLFFGFGTLFSAYMALIGTKNPGLIIDESGITVNSPFSWVKPFSIKWKEIESFTKSGSLLYINVPNPQGYIDKETNPLKKKAMEYSLEKTGAIFAVTSNAYQISSKELLQTLEQGLSKHKKKK